MTAQPTMQRRGGGWYKLPNGQKVQGKMRAQRTYLLHRLQNALGSEVSGRLGLLGRAGIQYGGHRDVYRTAGYKEQGRETFRDYWALYERDPVAGRVVDMPVKTTWKTPPEVVDGTPTRERADKTDFETAWEALVKRLRVWRQFDRLDRLARVGRYAVLLLGVREESDEALKEELVASSGVVESGERARELLFLKAYSEENAVIDQWDNDPVSERFGLPQLYKIKMSGGVEGFQETEVWVHHSRVLHVAEDPLLDEVYGRPALKRILNPLFDLLKVSAATGEAYWQLAVRTLVGNVDPEKVQINEEAFDELGQALEEIVHDLRRQFLGQGVDLKWLEGSTPDPKNVMEVLVQLLAVGSGIPSRVLFGSERGQLASDQDERAYFGMVNERQEQHAEPIILRPFIDRLITLHMLPPPTETEVGYSVVWAPLFEMSDKDRAEMNRTTAETARALTPVGGDPTALVEVDEERDVRLRPLAIDERVDSLLDAETEEGETPLPDTEEEDQEGVDDGGLGEGNGSTAVQKHQRRRHTVVSPAQPVFPVTVNIHDERGKGKRSATVRRDAHGDVVGFTLDDVAPSQ